jgi:nucleotide-binding universal stress UspA family protein
MKVLVPLDGSEVSQAILPTVRRLLDVTSGVELHLLTVVDPKQIHGIREGEYIGPAPTPAGSSGPVVQAPLPRVVESVSQAQERVEHEKSEWLDAIAARELPGATCASHVAIADDPADAIVELANELDAALIAMATHGHSGLRHVLVGSVAEKVIRESGRPVLVVGPKR